MTEKRNKKNVKNKIIIIKKEQPKDKCCWNAKQKLDSD